MSGPVSTLDAPPTECVAGQASTACVEISKARTSTVGAFPVRRALPRRGRRTVGPWCFEDHMGPTAVTETSGLDIGPHPHIGLHTVTWLLSGEVLHRDSLGTEQIIRAGQLNLMTAGRGVSHSEEATGAYRGVLHGVQLWVAQPEDTRHGEPAFEHHGDLPEVELDHAEVRVLAGTFAGAASPARTDTPLVGAEAVLRTGRSTWPLQTDFEYGLTVLEGAIAIGEQVLRPGQFGYLGRDRDQITLSVTDPTRALLIGGEPFTEPILMWWNFVARTRDELEEAYLRWQGEDSGFGRVASPLARIPAPTPYWARSS